MCMQFYIVLTAICCFATASRANYVDSANTNMKDIAELVCETTRGTKYLISRFSTISGLVDYLGGLTRHDKLYNCRTMYLDSIEKLVHVVQTAEGEICDDEKLGLIESYHRKYVSMVSKHLKEQKRGSKAPEMIKLFFMQYANMVSTLCETNALNTIKKNKHSFRSNDFHKMDELKKFTDALGMSDQSQGYNGIYLFWNMVDALDLAENEKFSKYLNKAGDIRASVQLKDARRLVALKDVCLYQMKPIYSKSMLPVLRLVDMGYYPSSSELADQLNSEPAVRSLFFATQICETILPLAFYSDSELADDQTVALTKEEASRLPQPQLEGVEKIMKNTPEIKTDQNWISAVDLDVSVNSGHDLVTLESIKSTVLFRSKFIRRMLKQLMKHMFKKFKSFKLFRWGNNQKLEPIDKSLSETDEEGSLQTSDEDDDQGVGKGLMRKKRGLWRDFFPDAAYIIYYIILKILKIVFLGIPTIIVMLFCSLSKNPQKYDELIYNAWTWGERKSEDSEENRRPVGCVQ